MSTRDWKEAIQAIPPVTRTLIATTLGTTLAVKFIPAFAYASYLDFELALYKLQIWRFLTPFFIHAPSLQFIIDMFMLYRNSSSLEQQRGSPYHLFSLTFCIVAMLAVAPFVDVVVWGRAMVQAVTYMWANENPHGQIAFWGMIKMKTIYFPWFLIALYAFLQPSSPMDMIVASLCGHLFCFLDKILPRKTGRRYFTVPGFMYKIFGERPPNMASSSTAASGERRTWTGGYSWGSGRRLGSS